MPNLDAFTLAVVSAVAALFMAITMAGIYLAGNRERAIADWAVAGVMFCLGHALGNLSLTESTLLDRHLLLALINASVALGYGMLLLGVQHHLERPRSTLVVIGSAVAILLSTWQLPLLNQSLMMRVGVLTVVFVAITTAAAVFLWRAEDSALKPYRRAVAVVMMLNAAALVARAFYMAVADDLPFDPSSQSVLVPVFFSSVLFFMALTVSLSLMLFRRKEVYLRYLARHDALTGLLNRYSLDEFAAREMARARRGEEDLSLVVLDLDNFKNVNDQFGHAAGDHVLVEAAGRLRSVIREEDVAFRIGGEEFLILLPGASGTFARKVAERLRRLLAQDPIFHRDREIVVSTSAGVVTFDPIADDWESLQRRADQALYRAKEQGRNRVEVAEASPSPAT
jgi:diguanylate cyclase (GGDEF)-like protein